MDPISWCAGFLDGEGCFIAHAVPRDGKNHEFKAKIEANQTGNRVPLDFLCEHLGGSVGVQASLSKISTRTVYQWRVQSCKEVKRVLLLLGDHLVGKRDQAKLLYDYVDSIGVASRLTEEVIDYRMQLIAEMKEMRRPTWAR